MLAHILPVYNSMKQFLLIFLFLLCFNIKAQYQDDLLSSGTVIESCNDRQDCLTVNSFSYLYYDESKNEFYLKVDFSSFRAGADTNDNWLNRVKDTLLFFKAIFPKEQFPTLSNQNTKTYKVNGQVFYGNVWKDQTIELSIYTSENSILNTPGNTANFRYDNYKVTFSIPFVPKDFKTYKKLYYNDQTVNINVGLGRINMLKPGMEFLLKDAYYQASR